MPWTCALRFTIPGAKFIQIIGPAGAGSALLFGNSHAANDPTNVAIGGFLIAASVFLYIMLLGQRHGGFRYRNWIGRCAAHIRLDTEVNDIGNLAPKDEDGIRDWCRTNCKRHWRIIRRHIEFESDDDAVLFFMFFNCPEPPKAGPYADPRDLVSQF